jgi:organic radical activating enzyme
MYHTTSFCHVCYREVQAEIHTRDDDSVWISKECPEHGHHEFLVEKDASFWNNTLSKSSAAYNAYNNTMMIEVTDRCNVKCEHCYHQPDNSIPDKPIEWVIAKALRVSQPIIQLIGAEPTLRDDLPEICKILKQNGKIPTTYSNGVRLKDKDYLLKLYNSGLASLSLSIHDPTYHNKNVWNNVKECIDNIHKLTESGIIPTNFLGQVSFNIREEKNVSEALDKIIEFNKIGIKCIYMFRSPAEVGWEFYQKEEVFVSTLFKWIETECKNRDLDFSINQEYGNSPYKIVVNIGTIRIGLVHWPSVKTIDMKWTSIGPYASFIDGTFGNLMIQTIQKEGMKKGWWLGHRIISNN